ncbi:hypothetical protein Tco_1408079 [Tanacetum coccineum]
MVCLNTGIGNGLMTMRFYQCLQMGDYALPDDDGVEEVTGMVEIAVGVTGRRWWCYGGVGGEDAGGGGSE